MSMWWPCRAWRANAQRGGEFCAATPATLGVLVRFTAALERPTGIYLHAEDEYCDFDDINYNVGRFAYPWRGDD
jgi:hypothetical protein